MVIFNQTFTADKPIYFPANWESGKTGEQLYLEWKASLQHYIISNILQVIAASAWIAVGCVLVIASKEIKRLASLDRQNNERLSNRKYLRMDFLMPVVIISIIWLTFTVTCIAIDLYYVFALLKGAAFLLIAYAVYRVYKRYQGPYRQWKLERSMRKKKQERNKKKQEDKE